MIVVVAGVAGAGKTTVGRPLADRLGWSFHDADDLHSVENVEKMRRGEALDDRDRAPWLAEVRELIRSLSGRGEDGVVACSALKKSYRDFLRMGPEVRFVYLKADPPLVHERLKHRAGHFARPMLAESQFDALEEPEDQQLDALRVDAARAPEDIVEEIRTRLGL